MNFEWATREAADPGYLEDAALRTMWRRSRGAAMSRSGVTGTAQPATYNGTITYPTATATSGTYTITCGGGGGRPYATSTNDGWVYLGATNDTLPPLRAAQRVPRSGGGPAVDAGEGDTRVAAGRA